MAPLAFTSCNSMQVSLRTVEGLRPEHNPSADPSHASAVTGDEARQPASTVCCVSLSRDADFSRIRLQCAMPIKRSVASVMSLAALVASTSLAEAASSGPPRPKSERRIECSTPGEALRYEAMFTPGTTSNPVDTLMVTRLGLPMRPPMIVGRQHIT
jgi:hypothetical protein